LAVRLAETARTAGLPAAELARPRRRRLNRLALVGVATLTVLVVCAVGAPVLFPYDPAAMSPPERFQAPSLVHPLGTDQFGRDLATRLAYGTRSSLGVAVAVVGIAGSVGIFLGGIAGFYRSWLDEALMRLMDTLQAFPAILLALLLMTALGSNLTNVLIALGVVYIPSFARITRASFLALRESEFVVAARVLGGTDGRLIVRHVLPNSLAPITVQATLSMGFAVLAEAGLSFLGLGVQPPTPSWGSMLNEGRGFMRQSLGLSIFPGLMIAATMFSLNAVGDALRDLLDPRLRHEL
jgi:peptide/nickel transport system permease protein